MRPTGAGDAAGTRAGVCGAGATKGEGGGGSFGWGEGGCVAGGSGDLGADVSNRCG